MSETTLWGIHGGATGDADSLFLQHNHWCASVDAYCSRRTGAESFGNPQIRTSGTRCCRISGSLSGLGSDIRSGPTRSKASFRPSSRTTFNAETAELAETKPVFSAGSASSALIVVVCVLLRLCVQSWRWLLCACRVSAAVSRTSHRDSTATRRSRVHPSRTSGVETQS